MTAPARPGPAVPGPVGAQVRERLAELDHKAVPEHVEVFDGVHRLLQDALATLDEV